MAIADANTAMTETREDNLRAKRVELLQRSGLLDSPPEQEFDNIVQLASTITGAPIVLINLADTNRLCIKAKIGIDTSEVALSKTLCTFTLLDSSQPLVVNNTQTDPRFKDFDGVCKQLGAVFYLGIPLCLGSERIPVGTLCILDTKERHFEDNHVSQLLQLARQAELLIELRLRQRELEKQLHLVQQNEERISTIVNTMEEGLVVHGPDGVISAANAAAERILGLTKDQLMGRTSTDPEWRCIRIDGSPFPGEEHPASTAQRTAQSVKGVVMGVGVGTDLRWILVNAQPTSIDQNGKPNGVVVTFSDISSLRKNESERQRAEEQLGHIFQMMPDLLCVIDRNVNFLRANDAWTKVLGWTEQELAGRSFFDFVHEDDLPFAQQNIATILAKPDPIRAEVRCRSKDGTWRTIAFVGVSVPHQNIMLGVGRDVTERNAREAELQRAKDAAEAADRAKSEFLATMSHEIRTPMNGVIGLTDALMGTALGSQQRELLRLIQESGRSLLSILNDILDWSRIEAGKLELEYGNVNVSRVVRDIVTVLTPQVQGKGLELIVEVDQLAPTVVWADMGRLRQILFNVVGNAVKFTQQGEVRIKVSGIHNKDTNSIEVEFSISDTGIGIAPENITRLFHRFSQVETTTSRRFGGSGLGLAISQQLARAMGGNITVQSNIGQGSTFTVRLPLRQSLPPPRSEMVSSVEILIAPPEKLKLLLAEDNPVNQKVALVLLHKQGHEVELANNGIEAVAAYRRGDFDAILLDVHMPEMDGLEAAKVIRSIESKSGKKPIPIVALTASAMPEDKAACFKAGVDQVLVKPVTGAAIKQALFEVLCTPRHLDAHSLSQKPSCLRSKPLHNENGKTRTAQR